MSTIEVIRLVTAIGYTVITVGIAYTMRRAVPHMRPLWAIAGAATTIMAFLFWLGAANVLGDEVRQATFNVAHWMMLATFSAWIHAEWDRNRG